MGGSGSDVGTGVKLDSNDNVVITGYFQWVQLILTPSAKYS